VQQKGRAALIDGMLTRSPLVLPTQPQPAPSIRSSRIDAAWAAAAGLSCLALYLATLQPDFGGPEDTPKFQFVGYVLGTPHPPGYPLYVWLSHLFVMLPVGSIAYRANLFSAALAALTCALAFVIGRQTGAGRWASLCAALALGAGASFWRSAVFAEVYSLAAVVAALTMTLLLAWGARPGASRLLAATGAFALGLGNHLTIIGIIPACVLYVMFRHRRAVTLKTAAAACVLIIVGVTQYGLIILRTVQGAPYLESRASSLRDLIGVVTAERFAGQRFAFGPWVLLTDHVPALASVIGRELGMAGVLLLAAGIASAIRSRNSGTALLAGSAAGMLGMVLNISGDLSGFITPVMVFLWPMAALGVDAVARGLRTLLRARSVPMTDEAVRPRSSDYTRLVAGVVGVTVAAVMPLANVAVNYRDADQSDQTGPARFFQSAFRQLPDRAGVVAEDYFYDMAIHYMLLTGEGGSRRGIAGIPFDAAEVRAAAHGTAGPGGRPRRIFAFAGGSLFLGTAVLQFERTAISGPPMAEWLLTLPRNTIVVGATAFVPGPLDLSGPQHSHARPTGRPRAFETFVLRTRTRDAAWRGADDEISMTIDSAALPAPSPFAGALVASAGPGGARIALSGQDLASVDAGLALAVFAPDGRFLRSEALSGDGPVRVPFQEAMYELGADVPCVELTTGRWSNLSPALTTGSWIATLPAIGSVVVETEIASAREGIRAQSTQLMGDGSTSTAAATGSADGAFATVMTRASERRPVFRFAVDRSGVHARARVRPGSATQAITVCPHHPARPLFTPGSNAGVLRGDFESEAYYGAGWGGAERNETGAFRRGEETATLLLPLARGFSYHLALDVTSTDGTGVALSLNGQLVGACDVRGKGACEVTLPAGLLRDDVSALTLVRTGAPGEHRGPPLIFRGAHLDRRPADVPAPRR
jgi:hypothetical protein